jgi:hypothetical protein
VYAALDREPPRGEIGLLLEQHGRIYHHAGSE